MRSQWEEEVEKHIRDRYPNLALEINDRSIIPSRANQGKYLEIDIYIPSLKLGIELNGETYHDHSTYLDDQRFHTSHSEEMYKEKYCERNGIKLLNIWSSSDENEIYSAIDKAIYAASNKTNTPESSAREEKRGKGYNLAKEQKSTSIGYMVVSAGLFILVGYNLAKAMFEGVTFAIIPGGFLLIVFIAAFVNAYKQYSSYQ